MNRYTVEINPGTGADSYFIELCATDENMVARYMNDPQMRAYNGETAKWRIVYTFLWFPEEK